MYCCATLTTKQQQHGADVTENYTNINMVRFCIWGLWSAV